MSFIQYNNVEAKIIDTKKIIEESSRLFDDLNLPSYVRDLQLSSFNQRKTDLEQMKKEMQEISNREEIELTMYPDKMLPGQIPVRTLNVILGGLQNLSDSIANTINNQPSARGLIPQDILESNTLIFKEAKAGSFKVTLEVRHSDNNLFDEPIQTQTFSNLFSLFSASDSPDLLVDSISDLGPRTFKYYTDWTKALKENGTPLELEWRSSIKGYSKVEFNPDKAERIYLVLNNITEQTEEEISLIGKLTGANVRTKNFELFLEDNTKITGRLSSESIKMVAAIVLDTKCKATMIKYMTTYTSTGREKINWTLKHIESIEN